MGLEKRNQCWGRGALDHELGQARSLVTFISPNPSGILGRDPIGWKLHPRGKEQRFAKEDPQSSGGEASFWAVTPHRYRPHPASLRLLLTSSGFDP